MWRVHLDNGAHALLKVARPGGAQDPWWPDRTPLGALQAEHAALALVRGVPVPRTHHVLPPVERGDLPGALMSILPGDPPERTLQAGRMDRKLLEEICLEMGRTLAAIHRVKRPEDPGAITDLPDIDPARARLLHMDFHLGNVLGQRRLGGGWETTGVVDWTCCHWGPRERDFAEMGTSVFATNPWCLDPFLAGYNQGSGLRMPKDLVQGVIGKDLRRRLAADPPEQETVRNLWAARIAEWAP